MQCYLTLIVIHPILLAVGYLVLTIILRGYCINMPFSSPDEGSVFGFTEQVGFSLDCLSDFYLIQVVFEPHSSGVKVHFPFLLHCTTCQGDR